MKKPRFERCPPEQEGEDDDEERGKDDEEWVWQNIEDEVEYFLRQRPYHGELEDNAKDMLRDAPPEVQRIVMDKGELTGNNPSSVLMSRIRTCKGGGKTGGKSSAEVPHGVTHAQLVEKVKEFQKISEDTKALWSDWIQIRGFQGKRDPSLYDRPFLWEFLDHASDSTGLDLVVGLEVGDAVTEFWTGNAKGSPKGKMSLAKGYAPTDIQLQAATSKGEQFGKGWHKFGKGHRSKGLPLQAEEIVSASQDNNAAHMQLGLNTALPGQVMLRGQLLQRGSSGWETANIPAHWGKGIAVRTKEVANMLETKVKNNREIVRCPLCKRGNKDRGSTCACFQDDINIGLLQATDLNDLLGRSQAKLGSFQSLNAAMALALVARHVEAISSEPPELLQDPRVQALISVACRLAPDMTRIHLSKIVSFLAKMGAKGTQLLSLAQQAIRTMHQLKPDELGILARDFERLLGSMAEPVLRAIAHRVAPLLATINIHVIFFVVQSILKCNVADTEFLTSAATVISCCSDDLEPRFACWLVERYMELGIWHSDLEAKAAKLQLQYPDLFAAGPPESYPAFLVRGVQNA